ncbi:hypothetical protein ACFUS2_09720 [[Kitasatospora] papulosa]|uniref:hypothetical protein n=1 Tax=[Kitasatospora] papulosa TaxID=1464011 RepID=UPI00362874C6
MASNTHSTPWSLKLVMVMLGSAVSEARGRPLRDLDARSFNTGPDVMVPVAGEAARRLDGALGFLREMYA